MAAAEGPVVAHVSYDGSVPWFEAVERSLEHVPADAEISHLLLVVHGVGHPNGDASGNIGLDCLINTFQDTLAHANSAEPVPGRVLVLGVSSSHCQQVLTGSEQVEWYISRA